MIADVHVIMLLELSGACYSETQVIAGMHAKMFLELSCVSRNVSDNWSTRHNVLKVIWCLPAKI